MKPPKRQKAVFSQQKKLFIFTFAFLIFTFVGSLLLNQMQALRLAAKSPVDAILVLGGSIRREIYVAEVAKQYPQIPILISQGSLDPCIWLIFQRAGAPVQRVWLEKCATSTFGNFNFSLSILQGWGVHKVKVITSPTHLPRAQWVGQILLGARGIWMELDVVREQGIPGNRESWLKTAIDVTRSLIGAAIAQVTLPQCSALTPLADVDMQVWRDRGFKCEHQGQIKSKVKSKVLPRGDPSKGDPIELSV